VALFTLLEKPPAVAFVGSPSAASGIDRPVAAGELFALPVTLCTTAPEPFVPEVSTPPNCSIVQAQPFWVLPAPKFMVTAPAVGAAPIALKRVVRAVGAAMVPQATVATRTQVRPLPDNVGVAGVAPLVFVTQARTRLLAVGVMEAVVYEV